jgi:hypothetical protein
MSKGDYRRALDAAVREYEKLSAERADLDDRLSQLRHSIGTLTKLCGYEPTVPLGLTDACRLVLRNSVTPLTALEVRDRLAAIGVDLDKYSNPLASIHTVLKRMHEAGEIAERDREDEASSNQRSDVRRAMRTAYAFVLPRIGLAVSRGKLRVTGQGLCPPKDRKK